MQQQLELTFSRALKVWWSFLWRTWILMIPATIAIAIVMFAALFLTGGFAAFRTSTPGNSSYPFGLGVMVLMYGLFIPTMVALQVFTMKLALRVQWSDFKLIAVGEAPASQTTKPHET